MKKILLFFALLLTITACKKEETKINEKPTIKIGAILPLSGDGAEAGNAAKGGLDFILEKMSSNDLKYNYEFVFEDNQMQPRTTSIVANKLAKINKVDALFSIWNMAGNIVADFADKNNLFSFTCSYGEKSTVGKYNYNFVSSLDSVAKVLVDELKKNGVSNVALFTSNGHVELTEALLKELEKQQVNLVFNEMANWGGTDFKMSIAKAVQKKPEFYIVLDITPAPYVFMKQLKEFTGRNDNVTTIDAFGEMTFNTRQIADGLWFVPAAFREPSTFVDKLSEEKNIKATSCTSQIAAALEVFISAYEGAKVEEGAQTPTKEAVNEWIWQNVKDFSTVAGDATVIRDGLFQTKTEIKKIKNSKIVNITN